MSSTLASDSSVRLLDPLDLQHDASSYSERFLSAFLRDSPKALIENIDTQMMALELGKERLPVTINYTEWENSYTCSPYGHYIAYGFDQIRMIDNKLIRSGLSQLIHLLKRLTQSAELNRVVSVNNLLYATVLYPALTERQIQEATSLLIKRYPDHAIVFRSVNPAQPGGLDRALQNCGYHLIPCREVYMTDARDASIYQSRMYKSDRKIFENSPYRLLSHEEIPLDQAGRMRDLYEMLNLQKYSRLNPQFNEAFFRRALQEGLLEFRALEKDGRIDALFGFYQVNGVLTSPLFGYDTSLPKEIGLYRKIAYLLLEEAKMRRAILNGSGGAGSYKKLRRAKPELEYMGIYHKHLSHKRQAPWKLLRIAMNSIGTKAMRRLNG